MAQPVTQLTRHLWVSQGQVWGGRNTGMFLSEGHACLIDPGILPGEVKAIARFMAERGITPQAIVLTHCHPDHSVGAADFPGVRVIAQANYVADLRAHGDSYQRVIVDTMKREPTYVIRQPDVTYEETMTLTYLH